MTNEEALKRFKWKYNLTKDYNDPHWEGGERREHSEWVEQLEIAINALEKQIPKKVTHEATLYKCCTCPNCKNVVDEFTEFMGNRCRVTSTYCKYCGQALDWEDNK